VAETTVASFLEYRIDSQPKAASPRGLTSGGSHGGGFTVTACAGCVTSSTTMDAQGEFAAALETSPASTSNFENMDMFQ
jgi:hypothetical protein